MGIPDRAYEQPMLKLRNLFGTMVLVSDPAGVRRVLVENVANYPKTEMEKRFFTALFGAGLLGTDGVVWRTHRRIMAPAFDPRSVAAYGPAIVEASGALLAQWDALPDAATVDVAGDMTALTLQIISRTMFSADSNDIVGLVDATLGGNQKAFNFNILVLLPLIGPVMFRRKERQIAKTFEPLDAAIARLIAKRENETGERPADLLSRLVAAKDQDTGASMTAREVRDEVITIFFAGHETTAVTMDWIWYVLSQHPGEEARLHAELEAVLGGRAPTQEDLPRLTYTRQVVEETMRLFPAAPGISSRQAQADDTICGVAVAKGASVAVSPWVLHRHRALWEDPERFDPDRFSPERSAARPRFAYLPFGAGPRVCIGQVLAMNEAVLILATIGQHYRLRLSPYCTVALQHNITLRPRNGLKMILERRTAA